MSEQKPNEKCPCCDREIRGFRDYPLMQILSVSTIKPEEVPDSVRGGHNSGRLLEETNVPKEVVAYFKSNPQKQDYAHSDGHIYEKLVEQRSRKSEPDVFWHRTPNISNMVRNTVQNEPLKRYLSTLEGMTGKIIPTKEFLNQFGNESEHGVAEPREIGDGLYLLLCEGKAEEGIRTVQFKLGVNPMDMGRLHSEMVYTIALENLATTQYVGKMLR